MAWVRSEYAGEFAVISAWLAMVLPWNVAYNQSVPHAGPLKSKMAIIRLSIFGFQFRFPAEITVNGDTTTAAGVLEQMYPGVQLLQDVYVTTPIGSQANYVGTLQQASVAWAIGALALLAAFVVSIVFYRLDDEFERRLSVDPVRLIGGLLGVATVALAAATVLYYFERNVAGFPIPIGLVVMGALSVALLRVERT